MLMVLGRVELRDIFRVHLTANQRMFLELWLDIQAFSRDDAVDGKAQNKKGERAQKAQAIVDKYAHLPYVWTEGRGKKVKNEIIRMEYIGALTRQNSSNLSFYSAEKASKFFGDTDFRVAGDGEEEAAVDLRLLDDVQSSALQYMADHFVRDFISSVIPGEELSSSRSEVHSTSSSSQLLSPVMCEEGSSLPPQQPQSPQPPQHKANNDDV
eukprot:TRINITY_DN7657_c0_g2_i1.p1 TRINITY_DN7657_c0_g2~~TRINITY_DN7657_c0_g2_i1.p1  ORF type:complete len:211 (-),score=44.99 TRINITY_DN7657_c0_g2_i1:6-638(-)